MPSMGPAVRAAAADARRQILELAAQRYGDDAGRALRSEQLEEVVGLLGNGQILGTGARGPNPAGMQVLTFGVQVAEVAVDVETGEVTVERVAAIHDVGRVVNPLGASSQVEGGIIQGVGHTLSEQRLADPGTGSILTRSLDAYRMPTIADVPEIVSELVDVPDEHLTNLGSKGIGEPPIIPVAAAIANAIRDATGADIRSLPITREPRCWPRFPPHGGRRGWRNRLEHESRTGDPCEPGGDPGRFRPARRRHRGRARSCAEGLLEADTLVDVSGARPARDRRHPDRRRHDSRRDRGERGRPGRVARGLPARCLAPAPLDGNGRREPAPVDAMLVLAARVRLPPPRRGSLPRPRRRASRARDLRERLLRLGASLRPRRRAGRARSAHPDDAGASSRSPTSTGCPTPAIPAPSRSSRARCCSSSRCAPADASTYLKAMDRKRFGFPLVGVAAVAPRRRRRPSPSPAWRRSRGSSTAASTRRRPFPGTAWKVDGGTGCSCHARSLASDRA